MEPIIFFISVSVEKSSFRCASAGFYKPVCAIIGSKRCMTIMIEKLDIKPPSSERHSRWPIESPFSFAENY